MASHAPTGENRQNECNEHKNENQNGLSLGGGERNGCHLVPHDRKLLVAVSQGGKLESLSRAQNSPVRSAPYPAIWGGRAPLRFHVEDVTTC